MKHCDHQNCKHEKVKFCEKCNNVFCLKCKREWDYELSHSFPYSFTYTNPIPSIYAIGKKSDDFNTGTPLPTQYPTITCSNHVGEGDAN